MAEPGKGIPADESFEREVLERSRRLPVVVDFWAEWCGPCRALGPILDRVVGEHPERLALVKVDVDAAPAVAQRYQVRSIPLVVAFRDGQPASEFTGAQPEPVVRRFIEALLPSQADDLAAEAERLRSEGDLRGAEKRLHEALELEPRNAPALVALAQLRSDEGELGEALGLLERVVLPGEAGRRVERMAAELRTRSEGTGDLTALRERTRTAPEDLDARLDLGRALAAGGEHEEALDELLEVVRRDPGFAEQAARKAMLDLFEVLGSDHPLVGRYRAALARALFR